MVKRIIVRFIQANKNDIQPLIMVTNPLLTSIPSLNNFGTKCDTRQRKQCEVFIRHQHTVSSRNLFFHYKYRTKLAKT